MQPIQDVTDARKTYTLYECEKCGSLRLERSGKPITKCAYCDNLSLKQRFLSALISIVHEATYKIPNPESSKTRQTQNCPGVSSKSSWITRKPTIRRKFSSEPRPSTTPMIAHQGTFASLRKIGIHSTWKMPTSVRDGISDCWCRHGAMRLPSEWNWRREQHRLHRKSTGAFSPATHHFRMDRRRLRAWFSGEGQQALALRHHDAAALGDTARRSSNDSEHA